MKNVIAIDDSPFVLSAVERTFKDQADVQCFTNVESFLEWASSDLKSFMASDLIITDYNFNLGEHFTGLDLAQRIDALGYPGRVVLLSDWSASDLDTSKFSEVLPKDALFQAENLQKLLA